MDETSPVATKENPPVMPMPGKEAPWKPLAIVLVLALVVYAAFTQTNFFDFLGFGSGAKLSGLEVASRLGGFLDKAKKNESQTAQSFACSNTTHECVPQVAPGSSPVGGFPARGYLALGVATNNDAYRMQAQQSIEEARVRCAQNTAICSQNVLSFHQLYKNTSGEQYTQAMELSGALLLNPGISYAEAVRTDTGMKLLALFEVTGQEEYRGRLVTLAQEVFGGAHENNFARVLYKEGEFYLHDSMIEMAGSILVPAYRATGNVSYLDKAQSILLNANVVDHAASLESKTLLRAAGALLDLVDATDGEAKQAYKNEATKILEYLVERRLDVAEHQLFNGDGGLVETEGQSLAVKQVSTADEAIEIFLRLQSARFSVMTAEMPQ